MAELNTYNHANQIDYLDESAKSQHHEDNHLDQAANFAKAEVNKVSPDGLTDFFNNVDVDYASEFWTWHGAKGKAEQVASDTRRQVFDVLEDSGNSYQSSLSNESYAPNLERLAWGDAQYDVLDMIDDTKNTGLSSLRTVEGYEKMLKVSELKTTTELKKQKKENRKFLDDMTRWQKFWSINDKDKAYTKFEVELDTAITDIFSELDENVKTLKTDATERVKAMGERVQAVWDGAMDPNDKQNLWVEIEAAADETGDLSSVDLIEFGIYDSQEKIDFVEALLQLEFVKKGLGIVQESANKSAKQEDLTQTAHNIETTVESINFTKFETLRNSTTLKDIEYQEDSTVSTKELVDLIISDLQTQGIDVETDVFSDPDIKQYDLLTESSRLAILVDYITPARLKSMETRVAFVNWYESTVKETSRGITEYTGKADVERCFNALRAPVRGPIRRLETCINRYKFHSFDRNNLSQFSDFIRETISLSQNVGQKFNDFERVKKDFPEADRTQLEEIWASVNGMSEELTDLAEKWKQEKKTYNEWKNEVDRLEREKNDAKNDWDDVIASRESNKVINGKRHIYEVKLNSYELKKSDKPLQTDFPVTRKLGEIASLFNTVTRHAEITPNSRSLSSIKDRIRDKVMTDFADELESRFLEVMESNDQYELLNKASEGAIVEIDYKIVAGTKHLRFPKELDSPTTETYRIARKVEGHGVMLEQIGGRAKVVTILGAAVSGKTAYKNAIVASTTTSGVVGGGANAIAFNMRIT